jgi:hypothetical protein
MERGEVPPRPRIDLAGSNLLACVEDLPAREAVDLAGESPEGYPPLVDRIASRARGRPVVGRDRRGCRREFPRLAGLLEADDEVLAREPLLRSASRGRACSAAGSPISQGASSGFDVDCWGSSRTP